MIRNFEAQTDDDHVIIHDRLPGVATALNAIKTFLSVESESPRASGLRQLVSMTKSSSLDHILIAIPAEES